MVSVTSFAQKSVPSSRLYIARWWAGDRTYGCTYWRAGVCFAGFGSSFCEGSSTSRSAPRGRQGAVETEFRIWDKAARPGSGNGEASRRTWSFGTTSLGGGSSQCSGAGRRKLGQVCRMQLGCLRRTGRLRRIGCWQVSPVGKVSSQWRRSFWQCASFAKALPARIGFGWFLQGRLLRSKPGSRRPGFWN